VPADRTHTFYQYCAYVPDRDAVVDACLRRGVDIETLHVDVCPELELFRASRSVAAGALETKGTIQIPVYESLTDADLDRVITMVGEAVQLVEAVGRTPAARHL
jgi:dTDP-4-amino-4,6-dideoxygalactose transaminase